MELSPALCPDRAADDTANTRSWCAAHPRDLNLRAHWQRSQPARKVDQGKTAQLVTDDAALTIHIVTQSTHPAHPAILRRCISPTIDGYMLATEGCAWGDRQALDEDLRAYALLDQALTSELICFLCGGERRRSPSLEREIEAEISGPQTRSGDALP